MYVLGDAGKLPGRALGKFFAQDFPEQACVVMYMYGWHAPNDMRCQMRRLFPGDHRETKIPNMLACLFTALSTESLQLMVEVMESLREVEDVSFLVMFRVMLLSFRRIKPFNARLCTSIVPLELGCITLF